MAVVLHTAKKRPVDSQELARLSRYWEMFSKGLNDERLSEKYTDFKVLSEDRKTFPCHKVVLAAVSPFFDTMFQTEMQETQLGQVPLPFDAETVDLVLQYIYAGKNVITDQNYVAQIYFAANYLQISTLVTDCENLLSRGMQDDISLEVWQVAKQFGNLEVAEIAKSIVLQNFSDFCHIDSIGRIGIEDLKVLLQDKMTNCSGKIKCKAAWVWLIAQQSPDSSTANDLISALVASENVDNEDILDVYQNDWDEFLQENVDIEKLDSSRTLWKTVCSDLWIQAEEGVGSRHISTNECLIVVGGTPLEESRITLFNFKKKIWYDLEADKCELGHRYAVCSLGSILYLSGGTKNQKGFMSFNDYTKRWDNQAPLPVGREQHNMCTVPDNSIRSELRTVDRKIYVLGGTSQQEPALTDVHVYNIGTMTWSKCGNLAYAVAAASSTVVGQRIYLLGGALVGGNSSRQPSNKIQCFDTSKGYSWNIDQTLPFKSKFQKMGAVCFDSEKVGHRVYVVHNRMIYQLKFNKHTGVDIKEVCAVSNAPTKGFAVSNFGDNLFIFGGEDDSFKSSKGILQYDISSEKIVSLPIKLPFEMKDFMHTAIPVPDSWVLTELTEK